METFFALLTLCAGNSPVNAGNSPVTDEFPAQRPLTWSFDVFFDLRLVERWSKQSWGWWSEAPSHSLWGHCNDTAPLEHSDKAQCVNASGGIILRRRASTLAQLVVYFPDGTKPLIEIMFTLIDEVQWLSRTDYLTKNSIYQSLKAFHSYILV